MEHLEVDVREKFATAASGSSRRLAGFYRGARGRSPTPRVESRKPSSDDDDDGSGRGGGGDARPREPPDDAEGGDGDSGVDDAEADLDDVAVVDADDAGAFPAPPAPRSSPAPPAPRLSPAPPASASVTPDKPRREGAPAAASDVVVDLGDSESDDARLDYLAGAPSSSPSSSDDDGASSDGAAAKSALERRAAELAEERDHLDAERDRLASAAA